MSSRLLRGIPLLAGLVAVWISTRAPRAEDPPPPPSSPAGVLASLPTRGLASAIAEAGQIEVPAGDPAAPLSIRAGQASRWTEGSYDVWHLTGGATIAQGATTASAHEAVIWIEQQPSNVTDLVDASAASPPVRSVLVRMAGNVEVEAGERSTAAIRGPSWAGRFSTFRDPQLDFASVVPPPSSPVQYQGATSGQAFAGDPIIFCQVNVGTPEYYYLITHKAVPTGVGTGFDFIWEKRNDSVVLVQELGFSWMAIGPMAS